MKRLLLLLVIAASAFTSGCDDDNNDPDPYLYSQGGLNSNNGSFSGSAGY